MGLKTMLKSEVRDILIGLYYSVAEQQGIDPEYRRGYVAALRSVALAIGMQVEWSGPGRGDDGLS